MSVARTYGGSGNELLLGAWDDDNHVYAVGYTTSEGQGGLDALIIKFNKSDLSIAARKVYGGSGSDIFSKVWGDADYVYAMGYTDSEGQGGYDGLIVKFNKSDLSIAARKVYGGSGADAFRGVWGDADYVYVVGDTQSEGQGGYDALIIKFNKSDLSIAARKVYGGGNDERFYNIWGDDSYVYAVGYTQSEGQGLKEVLIVKFNKSDLSIAARKVYGGSGGEYLYGCVCDADYVYVTGATDSEGQGYEDALIIKFNKSDLSIAARKIYGGADYECFACPKLSPDGNYVYVAGRTKSEGQGDYDTLIIKFNASDLSIADGIVYGGTDFDEFNAVCVDGNNVYGVGVTKSVGQGGPDALIVKFEFAFYRGDSDPPGFTCADSNLTLADSNLTLADSALTLADSNLTLADSTLTLADSALTLSDTYEIVGATTYETMVGGPTGWVWSTVQYGGTDKCPRGDGPTSWEWEVPVSGGPKMTPQGGPTSWDWGPE